MTLHGAPQLNARLTAVGKVPPTILDRLALRIVSEAKHRVARKTSQTGRTIRIASRSKGRVRVTAGGASVYLERGTRPHTIAPRNGKVLAWPASAAGRTLSGRARKGLFNKKTAGKLGGWAYAMRVKHPGTRAQPFMGPAIAAAQKAMPLAAAVAVAWDSAA